MNPETRQLLTRWQALETDGSLRQAVLRARVLWIIGLALCGVVVFGVVYRLHPVVTSLAAAAMGWTIAESNALRARVGQWPIFKNYIDWKRVEEDLRS